MIRTALMSAPETPPAASWPELAERVLAGHG